MMHNSLFCPASLASPDGLASPASPDGLDGCPAPACPAGRLRLLHEGIPPAPEPVRPGAGTPPPVPLSLPVLSAATVLPTPSAMAAPFSPAQLTASGFWPQELPPPVFSAPCSEPHPPCRPYPFLDIALPSACHASHKQPAAEQPPLYLCGPATSSMDVARRLIETDQLPIWGSVLALSQCSGRGQLGRTWVSPPGNVYAAVRLPLCPPFSQTAAAPALGGLLAEALHGLGFKTAMKWPNDLLQWHDAASGEHDGASDKHGAVSDEHDAAFGQWRKVGGILLEQRGARPARRAGDGETSPGAAHAADGSSLLAGIGLNLHSCPPDALLRAQRAVPAGCLTGVPGTAALTRSPLGIWMRLVSRLFICYVEQIGGKEEDAWRAIAQRHLAFVGQSVMVVDGPGDSECQRGILEGLDRSGGLILRTQAGSSLFLSGSLQLA